MAQAKARHEEFPGRFFNVGFVIDPDGEVILRHHKLVPLLPVEHSMTPHNVWDRWVELYGETLDAFYPVVDTEIGRLGIMMANEGSYPENARGLAMNGAEVVYRASFPHRASDAFVVQTRARALDNNMYVIAPNLGTYHLTRRLGDADRHLRRPLADRRLPRPRGRRARLQRRRPRGWRARSTSTRCATSAPTRAGATG